MSVSTLYVAHLRGPKIEFIIPANPYPIRGHSGDDSGISTFIEPLLVNTGNRPGILYGIQLTPDKNLPLTVEYINIPDMSLPRLLLPGDEWRGKIYINLFYQSGPEKLKYLKSHPTVRLTLAYDHSATFPTRQTTSQKIQIRVEDFRKIDAERNSIGRPIWKANS